MTDYSPYLAWLDSQHEQMCELVEAWANINSWSRNVTGLEAMLSVLTREFETLGGESETVDVSLEPIHTVEGDESVAGRGKALQIRKRSTAAVRVFLSCHMDTVYAPDHPFQKAERMDANTLRGPGVTDAKGGLVVMLHALKAFERSPWADNLGWEVLISPDEEIGSPGSAQLLETAAERNHIGLVFEPCFTSGDLVGDRKGSGLFTAVIRGKAAHAGREPHLGRNAISALAWFIIVLNAFASTRSGLTVNVGFVEGGGAANVVPDRAKCHFNVRVKTVDDQLLVEDFLTRITEGIEVIEGISLELTGGFTRPPKPLDAKTQVLFQHIIDCGRSLGLSLEMHTSGGACDGNNLAAAGLPTVDSLGPRGGEIHSSREHLHLDSLVERAKLTALLLMKLGSGEIEYNATT